MLEKVLAYNFSQIMGRKNLSEPEGIGARRGLIKINHSSQRL